jgi:hypothetical protein
MVASDGGRRSTLNWVSASAGTSVAHSVIAVNDPAPASVAARAAGQEWGDLVGGDGVVQHHQHSPVRDQAPVQLVEQVPHAVPAVERAPDHVVETQSALAVLDHLQQLRP